MPHVAHFPCLGKPLHLASTDAFIFSRKQRPMCCCLAGDWDGAAVLVDGIMHGPLLLCKA
jgi:hypothetical protein